MKTFTLAVSLFALVSSAAMAQQTTQSQQTGRAGGGGSTAINSGGMTSTNSAGMTSSGMRDNTTTGISTERGNPNGLPAAAPKATTGPDGQPSNSETTPK
jgi:long-subunit fatty acid transport protein